MQLLDQVADVTRRALLGVSAFAERLPGIGPSEEQADRVREMLGGNISPLPITRTRWYLADLEEAVRLADTGDLSRCAQLHRAMRRDGVLQGLMASCTDGLVRLPKRFYGAPDQISELEPRNGSRSVFDEMVPPAELAALAADGRSLGVGVGELVPVEGRDYPVLVRLDPEWLRFRWNEGRWYYLSISGPLPVTPGDGRWVLHIPGGRVAPWQSGLWQALGRAWINKEHALLHRSNYSAKLANPARVATAPAGADEPQRISLLQRLMEWGLNTSFVLPPGYQVSILESNGRGFDVWQQEIASCDTEFMVAIAGQVVTTTGGVGFANADIHKSIRSDIIQSIADGLAHTVNTQIIPPWVVQRYGVDALTTRAVVEWDVTPAKDQNAEAMSLVSVANAIKGLREALQPYGRDVDVVQMANRFGIPISGDEDGDGTPDAQAPEAEKVPSPPVEDQQQVAA